MKLQELVKQLSNSSVNTNAELVVQIPLPTGGYAFYKVQSVVHDPNHQENGTYIIRPDLYHTVGNLDNPA